MIAIIITIMVLELRVLHDSALGGDFKGKISIVIYLAAIPLALVKWWLACALYVLVAIMWLIPDRRIEKTLALV